MKENKFLKILCSYPVLLLMLYYFPFLGLCLIITRLFVYTKNRKVSTYLVVTGVVLLIPKVLDMIFKLISFDSNIIPYFNNIVTSSLYNGKFMRYSRFLIIIGILSIIISYIIEKVRASLDTKINDYMNQDINRTTEIRQKNDLIMQEKREDAKNTRMVKCPNCGHMNTVSKKVAKCSHCRAIIG